MDTDCTASEFPTRCSLCPVPFGRPHGHRISAKNYDLLRKPAGRLGVVSPCERSENKEGVWGRGVVDIGAFFGRNRRCLGWRF